MDYSLRKLLGLLDGGKREYRFVSGEVTKDEYNNCQMIDQLLFGEGGYVETLRLLGIYSTTQDSPKLKMPLSLIAAQCLVEMR